MISGAIEIHEFVQIHLLLKAKFGGDPFIDYFSYQR